MFKLIVFPIDRRREALNALKVVTDLVALHHSEVLLLTVSDNQVVDAAVVDEAQDTGQLLQEIQTALTQSQPDIKLQLRQGVGKPAFTICDVADELNADLIVMGSRGLDDEHARESVTSRVIGLSPCPVLVIP
jgi:nucleotide-binding universal stress UspA family protein